MTTQRRAGPGPVAKSVPATGTGPASRPVPAPRTHPAPRPTPGPFHDEAGFRALAESLRDVVATYDPDWVHTWISPSVRRVLGWDPEDLVGVPARSLLHPDDVADEISLGESLLARGDPGRPHRTRMRRKDGTYCWVENTLSFRYDEHGRHLGTSIITRDVDEQVAAERALLESEQRFARMFADHDAIMLLVDPASGAIVDANHAAVRFYGYGRAALRSMHINSINTLPAEQIAQRLQDAVVGDRNAFVFPHRLADGTVRRVEVHTSPIVEGDRRLLFSIIRDVTEELEARTALTASEERFRRMAESMTEVVATLDRRGRCTWISPSVQGMLGLAPADSIGTRPLTELVHPDDRPLAASLAFHGDAGGTPPVRFRLRHSDGTYRWVEVSSSHRTDVDGELVEMYAIARDVDAQVRAEAALRESQKHYQLLAENSGDVVLMLDGHGVITWASPAVTRLNGFAPEQMIGRVVLDLAHPDDLPVARAARTEVIAGRIGSFQTRTMCASGSYRWIHVVSRAVRDDATGQVTGIVTNWRDAEADVAAQRELAAREAQFRNAMAHAPIPMMLVEPTGELLQVNEAVTEMLGYEEDELMVLVLDDLLYPGEPPMAELPLQSLVDGEVPAVVAERRFHTRDGEMRWGQLSMTLVRHEDASPSHFVVQLLDVTEVRSAREELAYRALHDPLTGLANRELFEHSLQHAHERACRRGTRYAVLFCDLDRFKQINDGHGHAAGDAVLQAVAGRLSACVRSTDTVARFGGDEFVVIAEDVDSEEAAEVLARRIRDDVRAPVEIDSDTQVVPATSIGVALGPGAGDAATVVRHADAAVYAAKESGRDQWVLHAAAQPDGAPMAS